jgi:hypothetical protein
MNRLVFKSVLVGCFSIALAGCQTGQPPQERQSSKSILEIQHEKVRTLVLLDKIDSVERMLQTELRQRVIPIPQDIKDKANAAKSSICSDQTYLLAMRAFNETASNRLEALQAESDIYHKWDSGRSLDK